MSSTTPNEVTPVSTLSEDIPGTMSAEDELFQAAAKHFSTIHEKCSDSEKLKMYV